MNVGQLRAALSYMDQELPVYVPSSDSNCTCYETKFAELLDVTTAVETIRDHTGNNIRAYKAIDVVRLTDW